MQQKEINSTIIELTGLYDELIQNWRMDQCMIDISQAILQAEYHKIYERLNDINVENLVLKIIANNLDKSVLTRLRSLIMDSVNIYETRQNDFSKIDFHAVFSIKEQLLFADRYALIAKDKQDIQEYPYPTETERKMLLKENQEEKNQLDIQRSEYIRLNSWMLKNYYQPIYQISKASLSVIDSYFSFEKIQTQTKFATTNPETYFDMKLISAIHNECNDIQFENIPEIDLYSILNLLPTNATLIIKSGERTRMCYLIYKLQETLKASNKAQWKTEILKSLGIKEDFYKSKYKEPVSEIPSLKSESFAHNIDKIFNNIS